MQVELASCQSFKYDQKQSHASPSGGIKRGNPQEAIYRGTVRKSLNQNIVIKRLVTINVYKC